MDKKWVLYSLRRLWERMRYSRNYPKPKYEVWLQFSDGSHMNACVNDPLVAEETFGHYGNMVSELENDKRKAVFLSWGETDNPHPERYIIFQ